MIESWEVPRNPDTLRLAIAMSGVANIEIYESVETWQNLMNRHGIPVIYLSEEK